MKCKKCGSELKGILLCKECGYLNTPKKRLPIIAYYLDRFEDYLKKRYYDYLNKHDYLRKHEGTILLGVLCFPLTSVFLQLNGIGFPWNIFGAVLIMVLMVVWGYLGGK